MKEIENLSFFTPMECVVTEPFEHKKVTSQAIGTGSKIEMLDNKTKFVLLKVLKSGISMQNMSLALMASTGSYVAVESNQYVTEWAKREFQLTNGTKYIMVPFSSIKGVYKDEGDK